MKEQIAKIKEEYGFKEFPDAKKDFYKVVTDSIFTGKWDPSLAKDLKNPLLTIGQTTINQTDFTQYIAAKQKKRDRINLQFLIDQIYRDFLNESLIKYENSHLEAKYPEFRALMEEYKDGILLFDLTDQKVWSKAVKDTVGLKEFYDKNKNNYMWDKRVEASIFTLKDPKKAQKVKNFIKSGLANQDILKEMNTDSVKVLTIENGKFSKKDNIFIDEVDWVPGISKDINSDSSLVFVKIIRILNPEPKALNESRGLITADYQNFLEKIWIGYLRHKYPVTIHKDILEQIK